MAEKLNATAKELYGIDNFTDMIGDETIAEDPETLVAFLTEKGHPAPWNGPDDVTISDECGREREPAGCLQTVRFLRAAI